MKTFLTSVIFSLYFPLLAAPPVPKSVATAKPPVASKKPNMNFDSQLVEGQIYRPDLSVVTGDTALAGQGLLRLRTDFKDHAQFELLAPETK